MEDSPVKKTAYWMGGVSEVGRGKGEGAEEGKSVIRRRGKAKGRREMGSSSEGSRCERVEARG